MKLQRAQRIGFAIALLIAGRASQAFGEELDHTLIFGVGGASEVELQSGSLNSGVNVFVEYEAIENWLELELGVSILKAEGGWEVPIDLLLKKPFRLARGVELMIGVGPQIVRISGTERNGTFVAGELVFDFMFWPSRHIGLWVEPSYTLLFRDGVSHSLGATGGLLIGW